MLIKCFLVIADGDGGFKRADTGEHLNQPLPAGAMYDAFWYHRKGPDGRHLIVITPGGAWHVDGRANNCTRPEDDQHHCWVRHGEPPDITVDKNGDTCGCGSSIGQDNNYAAYHGFLRNGELVDA